MATFGALNIRRVFWIKRLDQELSGPLPPIMDDVAITLNSGGAP